MIIKNSEIDYTILDEKCRRKILAHSENLMMVEVTFDKDGVGALHKHVHEQISYISKGSFEFDIEGEKTLVKQGDSIYIPTNALHGVRALEDAIIIDVFTPRREDFLD